MEYEDGVKKVFLKRGKENKIKLKENVRKLREK